MTAFFGAFIGAFLGLALWGYIIDKCSKGD